MADIEVDQIPTKDDYMKQQREKKERVNKGGDDDNCKTTKELMKYTFALALLPFLIIIFIIVHIFTYATFRWVFWTRSWGSNFTDGEKLSLNGVGQLFGFLILAGILPMITEFTKIFDLVLPILPKPPLPFVDKIFEIGYKILMASTGFFTAFGFLNIIKRLGHGWMKPGTICPIKLEKYLEKLGERTSITRGKLGEARSAKTNAAKAAAAAIEGDDKTAEKAAKAAEEAKNVFNDLFIKLKNVADLGGYIYLESMSENDTFTEKIFDTLEITSDEKIEFLKLFISKTWNPFTFYINDPNSTIRKKRAEAKEAKAEAKAKAAEAKAKAAEAKDEEKQMTGGDGARLIAKSWMSTQRNATLNDAVDNAFDGRNDHFFSICCLTVKKRFPFLYPGVSTSNIYGPSFVYTGDAKTGIEAAEKGGCSPCTLFASIFLNPLLRANAFGLKILMSLAGVFLFISFVCWLRWWFGCWGWAEAEEQKDEEQKDRIENSIPLQKIDLMRNESEIKYKNGTSEFKSYADWVKKWDDEVALMEKEKEEELSEGLFAIKDKKELENKLKLYSNNKMVELFNDEGPEALDSKSYNLKNEKNEPAKIEWDKFITSKGKADPGKKILSTNFGFSLFGM